MKLGIREIPSEGLRVNWTKEDLKFNDLQSLNVEAFILPIQGGFDVTGTIQAQVPMDCSFCANSLPIPVKEKFHEVLLLSTPKKKVLDDNDEEVLEASGVDEFYIEGNEIDLTSLIRDTIETALPIQPKCVEKGAPKDYPTCKADWDYQSYLDQNSKPLTNPFDALKSIKSLKKN